MYLPVYLPAPSCISLCISQYLHGSPCTFIYLHVSLYISLYLHVSPCSTFRYLHVSPCISRSPISLYLDVSPCISMYRDVSSWIWHNQKNLISTVTPSNKPISGWNIIVWTANYKHSTIRTIYTCTRIVWCVGYIYTCTRIVWCVGYIY